MIVGSFISSRAPDRYIRPAITFVIFASGLKYVGLGTTALGWVLCVTLFAVAAFWLAYARPWREAQAIASKVPGDDHEESVGPGSLRSWQWGMDAEGSVALPRVVPRSLLKGDAGRGKTHLPSP